MRQPEVVAMAAEVPAELSSSPQMAEHGAFSRPGVRVLVAGIVFTLVGGVVLGFGVAAYPGAGAQALIALAIVIFITAHLTLRGLTPVMSGEARVIQLFG